MLKVNTKLMFLRGIPLGLGVPIFVNHVRRMNDYFEAVCVQEKHHLRVMGTIRYV
jgi:hypothetical protein